MRLRRRKPAPVEPAPPLRDPAAKLAIDINDAATKLAKAIRDYAQAPDEIPATIRADYATNIAFGTLVDLLAGVHARLQLGQTLLVEHKQRVLYALVVSHGLTDLLSTSVDVAAWQGRDPRTVVDEWADLIGLWTRESADLIRADIE